MSGFFFRSRSRNLGLHPRALLGLFVERESERFLARFESATHSLQRDIEELKSALKKEQDSR